MAGRSFGTTLKNLALALLNATLLMIALCLFLGWQMASTVRSITTEVTQNLIDINPVRVDVRALTAEVAELRADLIVMRTQTGDLQSATVARVTGQIDAMEANLTRVTVRMNDLLDHPEALINYAIDETAATVKAGVMEFRRCEATDVAG